MADTIAMTFFHANHAQAVVEMAMERNRVEAIALTPLQWLSVLQDHAKNQPALAAQIQAAVAQTSLKQYWNSALSPNVEEPFVLPTGQLATDLYNLGKTVNALGVAGTKVMAKTHNGKTYIILKGRPGLRNVLKGTRYLATNPRIVHLGLGMKGLKHVAHGGFILGVVVSSGVEVAEFFFKDEKTMYDLVGGIGVEVVKAGLVALAAYTLGAGLAVGTTVAIVPLVGVLTIAFAVGWGLNKLDHHYQLKSKVAQALKLAAGRLEAGYYVVQDAGLLALEILSSKQNRSEKTDAQLRQWDVAINNAFRQFYRAYR